MTEESHPKLRMLHENITIGWTSPPSSRTGSKLMMGEGAPTQREGTDTLAGRSTPCACHSWDGHSNCVPVITLTRETPKRNPIDLSQARIDSEDAESTRSEERTQHWPDLGSSRESISDGRSTEKIHFRITSDEKLDRSCRDRSAEDSSEDEYMDTGEESRVTGAICTCDSSDDMSSDENQPSRYSPIRNSVSCPFYTIVPTQDCDEGVFDLRPLFGQLQNDYQMREILSELEQLAMFVGCLCHDLDHRGTNNSFQAKTGSALALLYGTKNTMEHHHFNHAVMILSGDGHNIFSSLSSEKYSKVMNYLKHSILSTDLSAYFQSRAKFFLFVDNCEYDWTDESHREMLRSMLMTACDIASSTKPWLVQQKVAELVTREFFDQGDKEKIELNIQPTALMDRERKDELPLLQISWINDICLPLYKALSRINPNLECMVDGALDNISKWAELSKRSPSPQSTDPSQNYVIRETGV